MAAVHWSDGRDAGERHHVLRVAGTRTHVLEMGAGDPVILLHGYGDSLATWRYTMPALARHHRVVAVDLPGFGRSQPSTHRPLLDWYAHWTEELIAKVAPRGRASLVGNSVGAAIALDTAVRTPLRVSRLVLVDCAGLGSGVPLWWRLVFAQRFRLHPLAEPAARALPRAVLERIVAEVYSTLVFHRPNSVDATCARDFAANHATAARLQHLLDLGRDIGLVPMHHGIDLHNIVPDSQLYLVDDCGHCPQLERPAEFSTAVERFLQGGRAATSARIVSAEQLGA
jgi:pimeloyl-ACP methyl ester carboxylesterase